MTPQILIEFWAVATRPINDNGLGMSPSQAADEIKELRTLFKLVAYTAEVFDTWQRLVITQRIVGKQTHDAHVVAAMKVNSIEQILTFNMRHFERFQDITVLDPATF